MGNMEKGNSKEVRKIILAICIVGLLIGGVVGAIRILEHNEQQRAIASAQGYAYSRVNYAFGMISIFPEDSAVYKPLRNRFVGYAHLRLVWYERETGVTLSIETVIDYFSQEFEPDGSLRLYNNGKHPGIEAFVEWIREGGRWWTVERFIDEVRSIYFAYGRANEEFVLQLFPDLSLEMLRALARAEADPDYVLDLTSLQRAGY